MTEENLPVQTVGHISGYFPGQRGDSSLRDMANSPNWHRQRSTKRMELPINRRRTHHRATVETAHDPRKTRQIKAKEHFLRARPDDIALHNEKKIWYLMEFKRTSDVRLGTRIPRETRRHVINCQIFMDILRKVRSQVGPQNN